MQCCSAICHTKIARIWIFEGLDVGRVDRVVGAVLERKVDAHLLEILLDVAEVVLLGVQDLLLLLVRGAAEGGVLVASQPVPLEVAVQLEQDSSENKAN